MAEQTDRNDPHCEPCGTRLSMSCGHIHRGCAAVIPPDWRDVIREFLKLGPYLLERRTTDGNRYWRYETDQRTKGGLRELVDILHFPTESTWIVKLGLYGPHQVTLRNPTPAEVLTAARLVGLGGAS